jgi:hypothetical protein
MPVVTEVRPPSPTRSASQDVLAALRGDPTRRPDIDPGLAGGLREWLEDGLSFLPDTLPAPLMVSKQKLRDVLGGHWVETAGAARGPVSGSLALGAVMDALFRQVVTLGHLEDPLNDGLDALRIGARRSDVVEYVESLCGEDLTRFRDEVETQSAILLRRWPKLSPSWLPRTQERIAVPLAGGNVVLVGVVDLIVGAPSTGRASVALIEVKSGSARLGDREDLWFYALLETLRSGAPPSRVATFYTRTGQVDAEDIDDARLIASVQRVLSAVGLLLGRA